MDFVHLHVHSHYSLLDSLIRPKDLPKLAKERRQKAIAMTDTGAMYGAIEFYQACLANGVKPIIGFEALIGSELNHLVLLAENYTGYRNLMMLSSFGHTEGLVGGKATLNIDVLKKYKAHIIALSGCIRGTIPSLLHNGKIESAKQAARTYQEIFGPEHFYLELQDHPAISGQMEVNTGLVALGRELNIPLVVTRDVHYARVEDAEAQDTMVCIREGVRVDQTNREDFRQVDRSLNDSRDIVSRFRHVPEAIANTVKIADRVNIEIPLNQWHFAAIDLPEGKTADQILREQAEASLLDYYDPVTPDVRERLEKELGIIITKGYAPYFICVADFVRYAKNNGIVETTRGSAAGSLVSYVLGITTVDPIRFNIPFERFLNPYRPSPPDIDTDFADDRRDKMIAYVTSKYGADKVAQIITFGTMAARASVRDVGRALGFAYSF
ncbi:MAG: DNA polymerase III subunit alpha, partial [Patescibacteria group bacterium]